VPRTRARQLRLGGIQLSVTLDRALAERIKTSRLLGRMTHVSDFHPYRNGEPDVTGIEISGVEWFHTIDLGAGRVTPGFVDYREQVALYGLPESLAGHRCLDVGTRDGFWAFEMERRGAAEVVAVDVYSRADQDHPANFSGEYLGTEPTRVKGLGFALARRELGRSARRLLVSPYELEPERVGLFDFVLISDQLIHLRDPLAALEAIWSVTRPGGEVVVAEIHDPMTGLEPTPNFRLLASPDRWGGLLWYLPSPAALSTLLRLARFDEVSETARLPLPASGVELSKVVFHARRGGVEGR
jgi:tRNA (mo5U34)-methyltransferase